MPKQLKYRNLEMKPEEVIEYKQKLKAMKTHELIVLATLISLLMGRRFTQKTKMILEELDSRGVL